MGAVNGGHAVLGATAPATRWSFAEGYTGAGFDTFLTILNWDSSRDAAVRITYYRKGKPPVTRALTAPASRRVTVAVHDPVLGVGRGAEVAMTVESANGVGSKTDG